MLSQSYESVVFVTLTDIVTVPAPTGLVTPSSSNGSTAITSQVTSESSFATQVSSQSSLAGQVSSQISSATQVSTQIPSCKLPPKQEIQFTDRVEDNTITSLTIAAVVILSTLYIGTLLFICYLRSKGNCPKCKDTESKLQKWETGEYKYLTKDSVKQREKAELERNSVAHSETTYQETTAKGEEDIYNRASTEIARANALADLEGRSHKGNTWSTEALERAYSPISDRPYSLPKWREKGDPDAETAATQREKRNKAKEAAQHQCPIEGVNTNQPKDLYFVVPVANNRDPQRSNIKNDQDNDSIVRDTAYWNSYSRDLSCMTTSSFDQNAFIWDEHPLPPLLRIPSHMHSDQSSNATPPATYSQYMRRSYGRKIPPAGHPMESFNVEQDDETKKLAQQYRRACHAASRTSNPEPVRDEARRTSDRLAERIRKKRSRAYGGMSPPRFETEETESDTEAERDETAKGDKQNKPPADWKERFRERVLGPGK